MTELGYLLIIAGAIWAAYQWLGMPSKSTLTPVKSDDWRLTAHSQLDALLSAFEANKIETQELRQAGKRLYDKAGVK